MIVVDTSALMAIAQGEVRGPACFAAIQTDGEAMISAATVAESLVVAAGRGVRVQMESLIEELPLEIVALTSPAARAVGEAYQRWGRGFHPAGLNFGDCFSYELAQRYSCPLLYVGNDFTKTDIPSAI